MPINNAEGHMKMSMLLCILEDMQDYSLFGIASLLNVPEDKTELLLRFLAEYRIIIYDEKRKTAAICDDFLALR